MTSLGAALAQLQPAGDGFTLAAPKGWTQGRTLYGGMTTALSYVALRRAFAPLPPLRSLQITFIGPPSGQLTFQPTLVRKGRSSIIAGVDCLAETGVVARGLFIFGEPRESVIGHDNARPPAVPPPQDCPELLPDIAQRPEFFQNFETRMAGGARPMSGGGEPTILAWVRFREDEGDDAVAALLAMGDTLPPAAMVQFPRFAPMSSMNWSLDLHHPVTGGGWRLLRSSSEQTAAGYSLQSMEQWNAAGQRVSVGRQCVALFI
jgi:acyl-CoA thioesterase